MLVRLVLKLENVQYSVGCVSLLKCSPWLFFFIVDFLSLPNPTNYKKSQRTLSWREKSLILHNLYVNNWPTFLS